MKKILLLTTGFLWFTLSQAQDSTGSKPSFSGSQMAFGYNMMLPMGAMKTGWSSAHGMQAELLLGIGAVPGLKVGLEGAFSMYGYREENQEYLIFNGILASSEVSMSSYTWNLGLKAMMEPPKQMAVKPYVAVQAGVLGMISDLTLDDFSGNDYYYCTSDYTKNLIDDADWYASAGAGLKFDLSTKKKPGRNFLDLYAGYIGGGEVKYANMNRLATTPIDTDKSREVIKIVFVNAITNEQQEQEVAEVYRHPISMLQLQLKYTFHF
ncbi:MAG: hypothetical protein MUF29_04440 [Chitinophagaceae bacterium]|nr:hypothetical protein [Chitinophagaceae bacterium]